MTEAREPAGFRVPGSGMFGVEGFAVWSWILNLGAFLNPEKAYTAT